MLMGFIYYNLAYIEAFPITFTLVENKNCRQSIWRSINEILNSVLFFFAQQNFTVTARHKYQLVRFQASRDLSGK